MSFATARSVAERHVLPAALGFAQKKVFKDELRFAGRKRSSAAGACERTVRRRAQPIKVYAETWGASFMASARRRSPALSTAATSKKDRSTPGARWLW